MTGPALPAFKLGRSIRRQTSYSADLEQALADSDLAGLDIQEAKVVASLQHEDAYYYVLIADAWPNPVCLPANVIDAAFELSDPRRSIETSHQRGDEAAEHGPFMARGAVIEIIENGATASGDSAGASIIVPNDIRINGQSLLAPDDAPVIVHEISSRGDEAVRVTLTLFARRVVYRAEHDQEA